jgi:hypothetical protein
VRLDRRKIAVEPRLQRVGLNVTVLSVTTTRTVV